MTSRTEIKPPEFREHIVYGEDFFDARRHPTITFGSNDVKLGVDGTATLQGELTIRGICRTFTATGTYSPLVEDPSGSQRAGFELSSTIDRRDWGLNYQMPLPNGAIALGWDVVLTAHVELVKRG
ncbi:MAG: YceI family protein [Nocardioidaceae bacterium]